MSDDIVGKLGLDARDFKRVLGGLPGMARDAGKKILSAFEGVQGQIAGLFSVGALAGMATKLADYVGQIKDASENLGVSTDFIQAFTDAAEKSGIKSEKATDSLGKLVAKMGEARQGSGAAADAFKRLGVDLENSDGTYRNTEQVFKDVSTAISNIKDPVEQARAAISIFGESGVKMLGFLRQGPGAIDEFIAAAKGLSSETINAVDEAEEAIKSMGKTLMTWFANAVGGLARLAIAAGQLSVDMKNPETQKRYEELRKEKGHGAALGIMMREARERAEAFIKAEEDIAKAQQVADDKAAASARKLAQQQEARERTMKAFQALQKFEQQKAFNQLSTEQKLLALQQERAKVVAQLEKREVATEATIQRKLALAQRRDELDAQIQGLATQGKLPGQISPMAIAPMAFPVPQVQLPNYTAQLQAGMGPIAPVSAGSSSDILLSQIAKNVAALAAQVTQDGIRFRPTNAR